MTPQQILTLAAQAMQRGDWPSAARALHEGLAGYPGQADLLGMMAIAVYRAGRPEQAVEWLRRAAEAGGNAAGWCNLGSALCDLGRFAEAHDALQRAAALAPDDAFMHFCLARALAGMGRQSEALAHVGSAIAHAPGDIDFRLFRARLAVELDQWDLALSDLDALSWAELPLGARIQAAALLLQTGQFMRAIGAYRAVLERTPAHFESWLGLAAAYERANDLDGMRAAVAAAARHADTPQREAALDHLRGKSAFRDGDYGTASALLRHAWRHGEGNPLWKSQVGFELAQSLDKAKRYPEAWQTLNQAHDIRNRVAAGSGGDRQALDFFAQLRTPVDGRWPAPAPDDGRLDPVFVVGFPRSGTTLLEQILDARPGLVSFDEQPFLPKTLLELQKFGLRYPEQLSALEPAQIGRLRSYYFAQAESKAAAGDGVRLVDKNPLNWARLPLVRALFPRAHVILALRHPLDVILSCYMQNLRSTVLGGAFSHFGRIVELYAGMVEYWRRLEPALDLPVLVSRYEDLVSDPEAGTRRIAEFLGLPWDAGWLDSSTHARGKAVIHTPSYAQVLEPLNTRAMGRWRNYRDLFDPAALDALRPAAEAMGYPLD